MATIVMADAALDYLRRGWPVIPGHNPIAPHGLCSCGKLACDKPGKHPRIGWREFEQHLPTEAQVRSWWHRWPDASVIVLTGRLSGLLVLDIDPRSGGDDSLAELPKLPPTVTVLTGGGGEHYWFRYPQDSNLTIGAGVLPGIDWRGQGGYVVAPPSLHASGRRYEWEAGYSPDEHPLADAPDTLLAALQATRGRVADFGVLPVQALDVMPYLTGQARLQVGERNTMLARLAGQQFAQGAPLQAVLGTLLAVAANAESDAAHPPIALDEVQAVVRSIYQLEQRKQQAAAALADATTMERLAELAPDDKAEMARALWRDLGVDNVVAWVKVVGGEGYSYELEVGEHVISLGSSLLSAQAKIRDTMLSAAAILLRAQPKADWERTALQLARLASENYVFNHRSVRDRITEWLLELRTLCEQPSIEERRSVLAHYPIYWGEGLAIRTRRFTAWLEASFGEKLTTHQLGKLLVQAGWEYRIIDCGPGGRVKAWVSPAFPAED